MEGVILISAFFVCLTFVLFYAFLCDKLAKLLHDKYPQEWKREGKPYFYGSNNADLLGFATNRFRTELFWRTPNWAVTDSEARRLISQLRWTVIIGGLIGSLPFLFILAVYTFS